MHFLTPKLFLSLLFHLTLLNPASSSVTSSAPSVSTSKISTVTTPSPTTSKSSTTSSTFSICPTYSTSPNSSAVTISSGMSCPTAAPDPTSSDNQTAILYAVCQGGCASITDPTAFSICVENQLNSYDVGTRDVTGLHKRGWWRNLCNWFKTHVTIRVFTDGCKDGSGDAVGPVVTFPF